MTSWYEIPDAVRAAMNVDPDFCSCLEYNPQDGWGMDNVHKVLAVVEGEHDGANWHWIVELTRMPREQSFVYLTGGCDYTGWD